MKFKCGIQGYATNYYYMCNKLCIINKIIIY